MSDICAYAELVNGELNCLSLQEHLARTAYIAHSLFQRRVEVSHGPLGRLNRLFETRGPRPATMILVLAALLHDVGKASSMYRLHEDKGYATYPLHEHVSSHLVGLKIIDMYREGGGANLECARWLRLVAAVISRHHSAMHCRHPDELVMGECRWGIERLRKAVAGVSRDRVLEALPSKVRGLVEGLGLVGGGSTHHVDETLRLSTSRAILQSLGHSLEQAGGRGHGAWVLPSVQALSGALIVSDILVAWRERCKNGKCKEPDKAYARSWLSELDATSHLDKAMNRPLEELLDPVVDVLEQWRMICGG